MAARRALLYLAIAALAASSGFAAPAAATSIVATPPHKPEQACGVVAGLIHRLATAERREVADTLLGLQVTTDALGYVEWKEWDALLAEMRTHNDKPDAAPMRLTALRRIDNREEKTEALYVAIVERDRWELERYAGDDGMLMPVYEPDPHYATSRDFWIVGFTGNRVGTLRQAGELYPLAFDDDSVDCRGAADPHAPVVVDPKALAK